VAHEFFHLIQNHHTNRISAWTYHEKNGWFAEGTATWAMDEVFDGIRDYYHTPAWTRFGIPLLKEATKTDALHAYETVAFWKWAEANNATIIRRMLDDHFAMTHSALSTPQTPVENVALVDYLLSIKTLWGNVDFLDFVYKARYLKDFDKAETDLDELWSDSGLGKPKEIAFANGESVSATSGGSEDNPVSIDFNLKSHLTAEVIQVSSHDLTGTLHVRFLAPLEPFDARLIVVDKASNDQKASDTIRDISSSPRDLTAKLSPNEYAYIFVVDPRWNYTTSTATPTRKLNVWVEDPCGSLPANVIDIGPSDDLFVALTTAPAGSAVRLAPGTYAPPVKDWPAPEYGPVSANVLVKDLTLIGAGEGETVLVMNGDPYVGYGFKTYGHATIRNLTIQPRDSEPAFDCWDARDVTLCHVTIQASSTTDYGIIWGPWHGGATSLSFLDSTLTSPTSDIDPTGMLIQACYDPPSDVTVEIRNSKISGWSEGVTFDNGGSCGSISVSTDCKGFDNVDYNVVDWNCSEGVCNPIEMCP